MSCTRLIWALTFILAGCGADAPVAVATDSHLAASVEIQPNQFAVRRCERVEPGSRCLIVQAGGKALLFGAPEGAMASLEAIGLSTPDTVFVSSLDPRLLEGLARVRSESWRAGRSTPLRLVGPDGMNAFASGLDQAFARSDAVLYVLERPSGAFDSALITPIEIAPGEGVIAFDTGDLRVDALASSSSSVTYVVRYAGIALQISPCLDSPLAIEGLIVNQEIGCAAQSELAHWPSTHRVILLDP